MADETKIIQYADDQGKPAYALTHWQAIRGIPQNLVTAINTGFATGSGGGTTQNVIGSALLKSPGGNSYSLYVDDNGRLQTALSSSSTGTVSSMTFTSPSGVKWSVNVNDNGRLVTNKVG